MKKTVIILLAMGVALSSVACGFLFGDDSEQPEPTPLELTAMPQETLHAWYAKPPQASL